jgi:PAS domain S-box-containing protein
MTFEDIISPDQEIGDLNLSEIINVEEIQTMMDNFYRFSKIPMAIIDLDGTVLVGVGWQEICTEFHRVNPETCRNCLESDLQLTTGIPRNEYMLYKCKNGMWDMATPIMIGEKHMGNLFIGQFFFEDETIDYKYFKAQALKYHFDQKEYFKALEKVPHLRRDDLESAKVFFVLLSNSLSQLSYTNLKLAKAISESEKVKKSLAESKAHLERSQEIAHLGSWELDLRSNTLTWSDEVYRIFGLTPGEFEATYEAFIEAVHPDDRVIVDMAYSGSLREKRDTYEVEHRVVRKLTQEVRYVHEKCQHFRDEKGNIIRSVGMVHDITERKTAEKELIESKEKLNIALETGNIGVWEWNLQTDVMFIDNRMEDMFGLEPGEFGESYTDFENLLNEEDVVHLKNAISKALNDGSDLETVFRIKVRDAEDKFLIAKALIEKDSIGIPVKVTGVCFDITEMKRGAEKVLFDLNEELLRSNNELERFAYVASHDLQEPLRMVASFTQLLSVRYKDKLDKDGQEFIQYAVDGAMRMQNQINDLLSLSRIQTKGKKFTAVDTRQIFDQVLKNLRILIESKKAIITSDFIPVVTGDKGQIFQVFQNILGNSLKYCNEPPKIHVSSREEENLYIFSVRDNGIGIEQQYLDRIFQIFQRLHSVEKFEGTGMGLAICRRIIERHKGKIWVESEPGKGSTFYFTLPKNS